MSDIRARPADPSYPPRVSQFSPSRILLPAFSFAVAIGASCGGTEILDRGVCDTLIECATQITPQARDEYVKFYGEGGTCWANPSQWETCRAACREALDAINSAAMVTGTTCGLCESDSDCVGLYGADAVCDAGVCTGGSPTTGEGESGGESEGAEVGEIPMGEPAFGISITEVEANQGVAVLIGEDGDWVDANGRAAALVAGRDTLVRLQHSIDPNWVPRDIGAILHLQDQSGAELPLRGQTLFVDGPSDPDALESQFQFTISAAEAQPGLSYWVELVDVSGDLQIGLVPGINTTPEDFELVGFDPAPVELDLVLVPVAYTFPATPTYPSISDSDLEFIGQTLYQAQPVQAVNLEVRAAYEQAAQLNHPGQLLAELQDLRSQDGAAAHVYYHALVDVGAATLGGAAGAGIIASDLPSDAANRVGVTVWVSAADSAMQIAHGLGLNHGIADVECPNPTTPPNGTNPNYPHANGVIGAHGYAVLDEILYPPTTADLMTHCEPRWPSSWTWSQTYNRLRTLTSW